MAGSGDWAAAEWSVEPARLAPTRRRRKWNADGCQVEGCTVQLEARFHKICAVHLKAPQVAINGRNMRFCQKCAKFEALEEFEGVKRTCQRALAAHNLARQRRKQAQQRRTRAAAGQGSSSGSGSGSGSESSVSAPAAGSGSGTAPSAAVPAAAGVGAAGLGAAAAGATTAAPPLGLRPASRSLPGSQEASVAGLGAESHTAPVLPGLEDLLDVPALPPALWQVPGPAQQLVAPAAPAVQLPLVAPLVSGPLSSSGGSLHASGLGQHAAAQLAQQQAAQAEAQLAHPLMLAQQAQQAQQRPQQLDDPFVLALRMQQAQRQQQAQQQALVLTQQQAQQSQMEHQSLILGQQVQRRHAQQQQVQQQQQAQLQQEAAVAVPAPLPYLPYVSPGTMHRISLKAFGCAPYELGPDIRAELESMLQVSVEAVEAAIRPGCVHLTADLFLRDKASAAAATVSASKLLSAVRCPAALGAAASNAALLQWQGSVAGTEGGAAGVTTLPQAEPRLVVHPACIAAPAPGQPGALVRLELQLAQQDSVTQHNVARQASDPLEGGTVLCRQSGRHLPVEIWGTAATAEAALAAASADGSLASLSTGSDDGSGSGSEPDALERADSRGVLERPWSSSSSEDGWEAAGTAGTAGTAGAAAAAGVWVRPVGLQPGRCELEVQLPLSGFASGAGATCKPVLLSSAAPLLVLPCEGAAAEVQSFLAQCSGRLEAQHVDDLLRDIGTAVGFLWQQEQQADSWPGSEGVLLPPHFVAAAAVAAADYVQHAGGMPRLLALLQRAAQAAAAACEGIEPVPAWDAAELAQGSSMEAQLSSTKGSGHSGLSGSAGSGPSSPMQLPAGSGSYYGGEDEENACHCTPPEQLELEAAAWGALDQEARHMPAYRWLRWAAAITACFLALLTVRLVLMAAYAPGQGGGSAI